MWGWRARLTYRDASRLWYQDDTRLENGELFSIRRAPWRKHLERSGLSIGIFRRIDRRGRTASFRSPDRQPIGFWGLSSHPRCVVVSGSRYWGGISRNSSSQHTRRTDTATAILRRRTVSCATDHARKQHEECADRRYPRLGSGSRFLSVAFWLSSIRYNQEIFFSLSLQNVNLQNAKKSVDKR